MLGDIPLEANMNLFLENDKLMALRAEIIINWDGFMREYSALLCCCMLNGFLPCSGTDAVTVLLLIFFLCSRLGTCEPPSSGYMVPNTKEKTLSLGFRQLNNTP